MKKLKKTKENKMKYLYIFRLNELDSAQRFRFNASFWVAVYLMLMIPLITKWQGLYFTTQLITIIILLRQIGNKFLEKITERFIIGQIFHLVAIATIIETLILVSYFFINTKVFTYIYVFYDIIFSIIISSYSIKLTSLFAKKYPNQVKKLEIFKQNVWSEGMIIGLVLSLILQQFGTIYVIISALTIRAGITLYFLLNWNFFDKYFKFQNCLTK